MRISYIICELGWASSAVSSTPKSQSYNITKVCFSLSASCLKLVDVVIYLLVSLRIPGRLEIHLKTWFWCYWGRKRNVTISRLAFDALTQKELSLPPGFMDQGKSHSRIYIQRGWKKIVLSCTQNKRAIFDSSPSDCHS